MKTETSFSYSIFPLKRAEDHKANEEKNELKMIWRSDLKNHRFALIDNKTIHDPSNWDSSWFANYE